MSSYAALPPDMPSQSSESPSLRRRWQQLAWGWLLVSLLLTATLLWLLPQRPLNSSVMALLPKEEAAGRDPQWQAQLSQRLDRQLLWLVSLPPGESGVAAASWWEQQLGQLSALQRSRGADQVDPQAWRHYLQSYRYQRLDEKSRERLSQGAAAWSQWVLGQIYSPFAGVSPAEWQVDPLLLTRSALQGQLSGPLRQQGGWLVSRDEEGRDWYLLRAELKGSAFDMAAGHELVSQLAQREQELQSRFPGSELLRRGTLYYSDHAAQLAKADISTIGLGSLLGVMLLIWWVFRGWRPLLLCLLPLLLPLLLVSFLACFSFWSLRL